MPVRNLFFALALCLANSVGHAEAYDWPQVCVDAYLLSESGAPDLEQVIAMYDECLSYKLSPHQRSMVLYNRGNAYSDFGELEEAIQDYNGCLKRDPDNAQAWGNRAFTMKELGRIGQAKADAARAKKLDPKVRVPKF